ncbi:8292_t:CDS:2 [Ambispora gerdemannii]|uniref:8292_t:CDS:1 n=1 Tax=Ambispora gerdemannii TaxID=144530 RepID=A0A9N8Z747_9GLOM|nr:8292_t:CDS:2 [Ambispora gerdemannii]
MLFTRNHKIHNPFKKSSKSSSQKSYHYNSSASDYDFDDEDYEIASPSIASSRRSSFSVEEEINSHHNNNSIPIVYQNSFSYNSNSGFYGAPTLQNKKRTRRRSSHGHTSEHVHAHHHHRNCHCQQHNTPAKNEKKRKYNSYQSSSSYSPSRSVTGFVLWARLTWVKVDRGINIRVAEFTLNSTTWTELQQKETKNKPRDKFSEVEEEAA